MYYVLGVTRYVTPESPHGPRVPVSSLLRLSLARFRWPYDTKGIVKRKTLMYITNTLQLECSSPGLFPLLLRVPSSQDAFSLSALSLSSYRRNPGRDKPSCGRTSPPSFRR